MSNMHPMFGRWFMSSKIALHGAARAAACAGLACFVGCASTSTPERGPAGPSRLPIAVAADSANPLKATWNKNDLNRMLDELPPSELQAVLVGLELRRSFDPHPESITARADAIRDIRAALVKRSSHSLAIWKSTDVVPYDKIVLRVAEDQGIPAVVLQRASTFEIEQRIALRLLGKAWDELSAHHRNLILDQLGKRFSAVRNQLTERSTGAAVAGVLAADASKEGDRFYETVLPALALAAEIRRGSSDTSWEFAGNLLAASMSTHLAIVAAWEIWKGQPDSEQCAAFICQLNALRARAWRAAGRELPRLQLSQES